MSIPNQSPPAPHAVFSEEHPQATILVAEDPFINTFLRTVLQRRHYKVVTSEASHAGEFLRSGRVAADVVITNNPAAFLPFADILPMLYIAANPDPGLASQFRICRVLQKPFRNNELMERVEELVGFVVP